jgi:glyoxylase-like metal-dependent hydrolase (beta-lactamase superfamily II)
MKKLRKRILLVLLVLVLIPVIFFIWFTIRVNAEGKTMSPLTTRVLIDSVYCIGDGITNIYLIRDGEKYIAFDAGKDANKLLAGMKEYSISPEDIEALFLTHTDPDHIALLKSIPQATIYLSQKEMGMVTDKDLRMFVFKNKLPKMEYKTLDNREIVNVGKHKIMGILVPGHTKGSMCYVLNDRDLFTGDAFSIRNGKTESFNEFFNMNTKQSIESLKELNNLTGVAYFFTGHYGWGEYFRFFKTNE